MRIRKSLASGAAVAAAAVLVLTARGGGQTSSTPQTSGEGPTGEINVGVACATTDYGPVTTSALALGTNWHVLEGLYAFDMVDYSVRPALAKGGPVEVSATEYGVALRDGAKSSDGTAVTANDVVVSYERAVDPTSIYKQFFTFVDSVTAKDSATVTIKLKYPFSMLKDRFVNVRVAPASMDADTLKKQPVGSEPYKYESISPTEVIAIPNDQYNGSVPATDLGYDPQAAKKQLADAGAVGTGITLTTTDHPWTANLVPQVKADLEALGLTVKVAPLADPYSSATDVDEPSYDIVVAPGDPAVLAKWGQAQDLLAEQAVIYPCSTARCSRPTNRTKWPTSAPSPPPVCSCSV